MKKIVLIICFFLSIAVHSQEKYKYVIVPKQFSFFNEPNKFNLNSLTKSFFESEGFTVFFEGDDLPDILVRDRCNALYADAIENNSMFATKIVIQVKDCQNKILLNSLEAVSREKSLEKAYVQVFREALTSLKGKIDFESRFSTPVTTNSNETIAISEAKVLSNNVVAITQETSNKNLLFALPTENGFKLVNAVPNVIFELQKTTISDLYLAERGMLDNGIFYKKGEKYFYEYYKKGKLIIENVEVKF
ncbi:conserved hypothetical protein [Flavobacterium sp. 9AF]|uniref:hypothetical protein n=1 Tax=Flavobacterium sp. 9AF TaxID=2653142 RepID=UPI0012F14AC2|nr:hypothetical protein [Flavobacterium sp. 9AF]VXB46935.1 conserved hypothetical protein [Flavobacterium sp. 9AF]